MSSTLSNPLLQYDFKFQSVSDPIVNNPNSAYNITPNPWQIVPDDPKFGQVFQCSNAGVANLEVPSSFNAGSKCPECTMTAWVKINNPANNSTIFSIGSGDGGPSLELSCKANSWVLNLVFPHGPDHQLTSLSFDPTNVQGQWVYMALVINSTNGQVQLFVNAGGAWKTNNATGFGLSNTAGPLLIGQSSTSSNGASMGNIAWFSVYNQAASAHAQLETDMNTRQKITQGTISSDLPAAVLQYDFKYKQVQDPIVNLPNPAYNMTPDPWKPVQDDPKFGQVFQCTNPGSANLQIPTAWNADALYPECTITTWVKLSDLGNKYSILSLGFTPDVPHGQAMSFLLYNTSNSWVVSMGIQGRNPGNQEQQLLSLSFDSTQVQDQWVYLALSINSTNGKATLFVNAGANWSSAKTAQPIGFPSSADIGPLYIGQSSPANVGAGMGEIAWFSVYQKAVSGSIELVADMMSRQKIIPAKVTKLSAPLLQYDFKCETPFGPIVNLTSSDYSITPDPWKINPDDSKFGQVFQCSKTGAANLPVPHNFSVNSLYPECTITIWVKLDNLAENQTIYSIGDNGKSLILFSTTDSFILSYGSPGRQPGSGGMPIVVLPFEATQVQNKWVYLAVSFTQAGEVNIFMNAGGSWSTKSSGPPPPQFPYGLKTTGMGPILIGQTVSTSHGTGMGYIAWFAIYPQSASESSQLETDMNTRQKYAPAPPSYPDKLIDFNFSNISGSTLTNLPYTSLNSALGSGVNSGADSANIFGNVLHFNGGTNPGVTIPPLKAYYTYPLFSLHNGMSLTAWVYLGSASDTGGVLQIKGKSQSGIMLGVNGTQWSLNDVSFAYSGIQNQWAFVAFVISSSPTAGAASVTYYQFTEKAGWISPQTKTGTIQLDEYCGTHHSHIGSFSPPGPTPEPGQQHVPPPPVIPGFTGQLAKFSLHLNQLTQAEVEAEMPHQHTATDLSVVYNFEGISGTTLPNNGNARFDGTLSAEIKAPVTDAELGKCLELGAGAEITIPGLGAYGLSNFQKAFSITAWVKLSKLSSTARTILALGSNQAGDNLTFGYTTAGWQLSYGGQTVSFAFDQQEVENQWVFVAVAKGQQGSITCEHYIGEKKTTNTGNGPVSLPAGVGLGSNSLGSITNGMEGEVAWFAIYNQELSQEQIISDMTAKGIVIMPDPILEFNFKSIANSTIPNLSNSTYKATYGTGCSPFNDPQFGKTLSFTKGATATVSPALTGVGADDLSKGLTIGCWVNLGSANTSGTSKLFSIGSLVELAYDSSSSWTFNSGSDTPLTSPQSTSPVGNWNYIAASLDSSGNATISVFDGETWSHKTGQLTNVNLAGINSQSIYIGAKSGASNGFAGDIAWLSVYKGVLSQKYFEEDMLLGKLQSNTSYRKNIPVDFKLTSFENGENVPVLFIEQKGQGKDVNLALTNVSSQKISIPTGTSSVSASYAQFQIRFKPGVLSAGFLGKSKALKSSNANHDDYWTDGRWQIAVYTDPLTNEGLLNIVNSGSSLPWTPKQVLTVKLGPINADPLGGVRGTSTMLHYMGLSMGSNPVSGFRVQSLGIVSHLGQKNIPMHVGVLGADRVLNNGSSDDLIIRIENTAANTAIPLTSTTEDAKAKFVIGFEIQPESAVMDWALLSYEDNPSTKLHWNVLGVIKTDAIEGATTIELDQPLTHNLTTSSPNLVISDSIGTTTTVTLATDATIGHHQITLNALPNAISAGSVLSMASSQSDWSIANNGGIPSKTSGSFSWEVDYNGSGELAAGDSIDFLIKDIICDLPAGQAVISFQYSNLGGYWGGEIPIVVNKTMVSMNQHTTGIGISADDLATNTLLQVPYVPNQGDVGLLLGSDTSGDNGSENSAINIIPEVNPSVSSNALTISNSSTTNFRLRNDGGLDIGGAASYDHNWVNLPAPIGSHNGANGIMIDQTTHPLPTDKNIGVGINTSKASDYAIYAQDSAGNKAMTVDGNGETVLAGLTVEGQTTLAYPTGPGKLGVLLGPWPQSVVAAASLSIAMPSGTKNDALAIVDEKAKKDVLRVAADGTTTIDTLSTTEDLTVGSYIQVNGATGNTWNHLGNTVVSKLQMASCSSGGWALNIGAWPAGVLAGQISIGVPSTNAGPAIAIAPSDSAPGNAIFQVDENGCTTTSGLLVQSGTTTVGGVALLVTTGVSSSVPLQIPTISKSHKLSIDVLGYLSAVNCLHTSDQRSKQGIADVDQKSDLEKLNQLKIRNYQWQDDRDDQQTYKGVIGQELKELMPEAVVEIPKNIPDIMAQSVKVTCDLEKKKMQVQLSVNHGLVVGDKVRLDEESQLHYKEVVGVESDNSFTVSDWENEVDEIFVYGKEVEDFHSVNYNLIHMLNVSATQQLSKEVDSLKLENEELKTANRELQEKLDTEIASLKAAIAKLSS